MILVDVSGEWNVLPWGCDKKDAMNCVHCGGEANVRRLVLTSTKSDVATYPANPLPQRNPDTCKVSMKDNIMHQYNNPLHTSRRVLESTNSTVAQ